jgi:MFS family permease
MDHATSLGLATAGGLTLIGLLGADKPPPPGFVVVLALAAVMGLLVRAGVPLLERRARAKGAAAAFLPAGAAGAAAGTLIAGLLAGFRPGEPSVDVGWVGTIFWIGVLGVLGALGGVLLCAAALVRDRQPGKPSSG